MASEFSSGRRKSRIGRARISNQAERDVGDIFAEMSSPGWLLPEEFWNNDDNFNAGDWQETGSSHASPSVFQSTNVRRGGSLESYSGSSS